MPLILQPATEADAVRGAQIEKAAYASNPFNSILFPGPFPEPASGQKPRAEEMVRLLRDDPSARWLKVVDTDLGATEDNAQMIGFAQWNINDGSERPAQRRTFGPGCNVEACEALFGGLYELRLKHYTSVKHVRTYSHYRPVLCSVCFVSLPLHEASSLVQSLYTYLPTTTAPLHPPESAGTDGQHGRSNITTRGSGSPTERGRQNARHVGYRGGQETRPARISGIVGGRPLALRELRIPRHRQAGW